MKSFIAVTAIVGLTAVALPACKKSDGEGPTTAAPEQTAVTPTVISPAAKQEASTIFTQRCFACHGLKGEGNGPASAGLTPPPRNFTDKAWQKSVTDEHIEKIVQYGGAAVGKSPAMPGNPDLTSKPEVVAALRQLIRELAP